MSCVPSGWLPSLNPKIMCAFAGGGATFRLRPRQSSKAPRAKSNLLKLCAFCVFCIRTLILYHCSCSTIACIGECVVQLSRSAYLHFLGLRSYRLLPPSLPLSLFLFLVIFWLVLNIFCALSTNAHGTLTEYRGSTVQLHASVMLWIRTAVCANTEHKLNAFAVHSSTSSPSSTSARHLFLFLIYS